MSGLLYLSADDFVIEQGTKGPIMSNAIAGVSLILFYSNNCQYCEKFMPIFKRLPGTINGCMFGMINVSLNKKVVVMSKQTIAPIKYVPYIVLYIKGKPYMVYNGPASDIDIRKFVVEVCNSLKKKREFNPPNVVKHKDVHKIPEYCIGVPIKGDPDDVCYLDWDEAYKG